MLAAVALALVGLYQTVVSPLLGNSCRFYPSCSEYCRQAITRFGFWRGGLLAGSRILRCNPLCRAGVDPVPELDEKKVYE